MSALSHLSFACSLAAVLGVLAPACADDAPSAPADETPEDLAYPSGPFGFEVGATLPDLRFDGAKRDGALGEIAFHDYLLAEDEDEGLLVIQVSGGLWCGTCLWYGEKLGALVPHEVAGRVARLDVVLGDRDNAPARAEDAFAWQTQFGLGHVAVAADPTFTLRPILGDAAGVLPLFVLVDRHTMKILRVLDNPSSTDFSHAIESAMATLDGEPLPALPEPVLVDGLFSENEWAVLSTITLPEAPPADPSNAVADSAAARALGEALYFDAGLSPSGTVSCATCHDPAMGFSDDLPIAKGVGTGSRRSQAIALSSHARWQFWDGRADSLWSQALAPFEDPAEFDSSRVFVAREVIARHASLYVAAFGEALPATGAWPASGKPGDAAYDAMPQAERDAVTRVFVDAGKAIAAYERSFRVKANRLDQYLAGDFEALGSDEKFGLRMFAQTGCLQCHWGPRLTDDAFHATRTPTGHPDGTPDRGRADGWTAYVASEFGKSSIWSDAPEAAPRVLDEDEREALVGKFKTPALRGLADQVRFGHGGAFEDLASVTESYGTGGEPVDDPSCVGEREPWLVNFSETASWGLVPFLETLTAEPRE